MAGHFLNFLDRYVAIFPELLEEDIYLAGESFGGQYIPYIAKAILEKRSSFKLRGLLIGDGWIDPISLYNSYLRYAIYYRNKRENNGECINADDIRLSAKRPMCGMNGPSELEHVSIYLNRPDVMSSIHINAKKSQWKDFADLVYMEFELFNSEPSIRLLPDLLSKIPIVFYNGEYDFICNHLAAENMLDNMTWNGESGFHLGNGKIAPIYAWVVHGESAGSIRYARNLTYILFFNAGHMVPYNQARRSQAMLHQFIQLNITYPNSQTIDSNYTKDNQNTHRSLKYIISIVCIIIVVVISIIWFLALKRQQLVSYTIVNNDNDEPVTSDDDTL